MIVNDINNNKWLQINFDAKSGCTVLELILCMVLVSKEIETYNLT